MVAGPLFMTQPNRTHHFVNPTQPMGEPNPRPCLQHFCYFGTGQSAVTLSGWEDNRRSVITVAMCYTDLDGLCNCAFKAQEWDTSTPPTLLYEG